MTPIVERGALAWVEKELAEDNKDLESYRAEYPDVAGYMIDNGRCFIASSIFALLLDGFKFAAAQTSLSEASHLVRGLHKVGGETYRRVCMDLDLIKQEREETRKMSNGY